MNSNTPFFRKVSYLVAAVALYIPIVFLSLPAAQTKAGKREPGGVLAELRERYDLSPAELGEIDPAGESMKLALVGLQGVAANILWDRANEFKKKQEWDKLEATVQQIIKLQPNFKTVWEFQAHNLTYNVSVEFDNYEHRYAWVKKGTEFLILGTHYNSNEPVLLWNVGWYVGQKIGRADEHVQFRRLFRVDDEYHLVFRNNGVYVDKGLGADNKPDNWFCGALWQLKAQDAVDSLGKQLRKSPLLFYNQSGMCLINGADAMEDEGELGDKAVAAWIDAEKEWDRYGLREIPTTWGVKVRLKDFENVSSRQIEEIEELDKLAPGVREKIKQEKIEALPPELRLAYEKHQRNPNESDPDEVQRVRNAELQIQVSNAEVARKAPSENRAKARALADAMDSNIILKFRIQNSRNIVNYNYWRTRCQSEKLPITISARQHLNNARKADKETRYDEALSEYKSSFDQWNQIFDEFPTLLEGAEAQSVGDQIEEYVKVMAKADYQFPAEFPLLERIVDNLRQRDVMKENLRRARERAAGNKTPDDKPSEDAKPDEKPADGEKPEDKKPSDEKKPAEPAADAKPENAKAEEPKPQP